jgi:hypothetical protein
LGPDLRSARRSLTTSTVDLLQIAAPIKTPSVERLPRECMACRRKSEGRSRSVAVVVRKSMPVISKTLRPSATRPTTLATGVRTPPQARNATHLPPTRRHRLNSTQLDSSLGGSVRTPAPRILGQAGREFWDSQIKKQVRATDALTHLPRETWCTRYPIRSPTFAAGVRALRGTGPIGRNWAGRSFCGPQALTLARLVL